MKKNPQSFQKNKAPFVRLDQISLFKGERWILKNITLHLEPGQRLALMGPSGAGKSTLLKVIAGLIAPDEGKAEHSGRVSMAFDKDELYPMLSCRENIEMGVNFSAVSKKQRKEMASYWAGIFLCGSFLDQKTGTLSAGQRKRASLARAMMKEPEIVLLDETFHALDPSLRSRVMETVLRLQKERQFILVFATHDEREAEALEAGILILPEETFAQGGQD